MADLVLHDVGDKGLVDRLREFGGDTFEWVNLSTTDAQAPALGAYIEQAQAILLDDTVRDPTMVAVNLARDGLETPIFVIPSRGDAGPDPSPAQFPVGEITYVDGRRPDEIVNAISARIAQNRQRVSVDNRLREEYEALLDKAKPDLTIRPMFDRFLELAPIGILILDQNDTVVFANSHTSSIFQIDVSSLIGMKVGDLIPGSLGEPGDGLADAGDGPNSPPLSVSFRTRQGEPKHCSVRIATVTDGGHADVRLMVVLDNTAMVGALVRAEELARSRSDFLALMSHELRTPLNAVIGFTEMIHLNIFGPIDPKYQDYTSDILLSTNHLLEIINDILDIAKAESGEPGINREPIQVEKTVADSIKFVERTASSKRINLYRKVAPDVGVIRSDGKILRQIVINLLSNAVKFTPDGGEVRVNVESEADDRIRIVIADTGIGIAEDDIPKALETFGQVRSDVQVRHEGTGLGLPLSRKLTHALGGSFQLESTVGVGTTVTIELPRT
ncbi:MAG: PAS domain-containing sensor histidine kinase [Rhodospirillales bacterium]